MPRVNPLKPIKKSPESVLEKYLLIKLLTSVVIIVSIIGAVYFIINTSEDKEKSAILGIEEELKKLGSTINTLQDRLQDNIEDVDAVERSESAGVVAGSDFNSIPVNIFYYNLERDREISSDVACSNDAVLPLARSIPLTATPIQEAINLLISGYLTDVEKIAGFTTEFPHTEFKLLGTRLLDGILTLEFTNPKDFTTGGACRVGLLRA